MNKPELDYVTGEPTKDAVLKRIEEPLSELDDLSAHRLLEFGNGIAAGNGVKNIPDHE